MITLGLDPHPGSHTIVALDGNGCLLANTTVPNTVAGLSDLFRFAGRFDSRQWAVEGAGNHFVAMFVTELLARGEAVYSIAPSLTSQYRSRRGRKKNDVIDAANVASRAFGQSKASGLTRLGPATRDAGDVSGPTAPV